MILKLESKHAELNHLSNRPITSYERDKPVYEQICL